VVHHAEHCLFTSGRSPRRQFMPTTNSMYTNSTWERVSIHFFHNSQNKLMTRICKKITCRKALYQTLFRISPSPKCKNVWLVCLTGDLKLTTSLSNGTTTNITQFNICLFTYLICNRLDFRSKILVLRAATLKSQWNRTLVSNSTNYKSSL